MYAGASEHFVALQPDISGQLIYPGTLTYSPDKRAYSLNRCFMSGAMRYNSPRRGHAYVKRFDAKDVNGWAVELLSAGGNGRLSFSFTKIWD